MYYTTKLSKSTEHGWNKIFHTIELKQIISEQISHTWNVVNSVTPSASQYLESIFFLDFNYYGVIFLHRSQQTNLEMDVRRYICIITAYYSFVPGRDG